VLAKSHFQGLPTAAAAAAAFATTTARNCLSLTKGHILQPVPGAIHNSQPFGAYQVSILP